MASPSTSTLRRYVLTASVTAITVTGALYGAGLKFRQDARQEQKVITETTPAEKIEQLEAVKSKLLTQKRELQKKIDQLTAKSDNATNRPQESAG